MDALSPKSPAKRTPRRPRLAASPASAARAPSPRLFKANTADTDSAVTIGRLVGIAADTSLIVGAVVRMSVSPPAADDHESGSLVAEIDFMGEIKNYTTDDPSFQRGVSTYPTIGNIIQRLGLGRRRHHPPCRRRRDHRGRSPASRPDGARLHQFRRAAAQAFRRGRHHRRRQVDFGRADPPGDPGEKANLRIFLIDPHNEYGQCFGDLAHVVSPRT